MRIQLVIEEKLQHHFDPQHLQVFNESHQHNVATGSETHFKVVLVSPKFDGERLINRHRAVNKVLRDELDHIHALALHTYTDSEWHGLYSTAPDSPRCLGGDRRAS